VPTTPAASVDPTAKGRNSARASKAEDAGRGGRDSPTGALVLDLLDGLRRERGVTLVVVSHDARVSARADRVLRMLDGRIAIGNGS